MENPIRSQQTKTDISTTDYLMNRIRKGVMQYYSLFLSVYIWKIVRHLLTFAVMLRNL